jgi:hypothetical protein
LSGWGGTYAFFRFLDKVEWDEYLTAGLPDGRTSPNQTRPLDITKSLLTTVLLDGKRFAHVDRIRQDATLRRIIGAKRLACADAVRRYFSGFTQGQSEQLNDATTQLSATLLWGQRSSDIVDLDSTVLDRFGDQEGSSRGYQPVHHGRKSHHPLLAMVAEGKQIVHSWLRAGSASPAKGCRQFFQELLAHLPEGFRIALLRADSGFHSVEFFEDLEASNVSYLIAMRMSKSLIRLCAGVTSWIRLNSLQEIGEFSYQPNHWNRARRVIVVRRRVPSTTIPEQMELTHIDRYEYHALVTNDTKMSLATARKLYNGRGDCENRIKELKHDFNVRGFCLQSFPGTEATFRLICFLHNLVAAFREQILRDTHTTLATIRSALFVVGAQLGSSARKQILRLGLSGRWREEYDTLLDRVESASLSTAAQLQKYLNSEAYMPPSPWKLRKPTFAFVTR